jgi:hypothetical protein
MFFRKKGRLRREYDEKLLIQLETLKQSRHYQKNLLEKCLDPSNEVIMQLKLIEAKYFFLLKEAKKRQISMLK